MISYRTLEAIEGNFSIRMIPLMNILFQDRCVLDATNMAPIKIRGLRKTQRSDNRSLDPVFIRVHDSYLVHLFAHVSTVSD